jgi:hypothetical protein
LESTRTFCINQLGLRRIRREEIHEMAGATWSELIQGGPAPSKALRKVVFDNSTEWTKFGKPGQQGAGKEGAFVMPKGMPHTTLVDLRLPR